MSCSSDDQSDKECPLCMEALEIDDVDFYPCKCEYQICRFCWHRIRTDENGLCPACRQPYPEDPVNFKPLSTADLQKIKSEKKMKAQAERQRISESRKHLASYRVLQKNLVYVVGLSQRVADPDVLKRPEYFGRFGKIVKVVVGTTTNAPPQLASSHTAYVTYSKVEEALRAIQSVNNAALDGRVVRASLGTTKYCSSFLRSQQCYKQECMYLHDIADSDISFTKDDMHMGKHAEYERRLIEQVLSRVPPPQAHNTPVATVQPTVRAPPQTSRASSSDERNPQLGKKDSSSDKENEDAVARARLREEEEEEERREAAEAERLKIEQQTAAAELKRLEDDRREQEKLEKEHAEKKRLERERLEAEARERKERDEQEISRQEALRVEAAQKSLTEPSILSDDGFMSPLTSALPQTSRLQNWTKRNPEESPINAPAPLGSWQALLGLAPSEPTVTQTHEDTTIHRPLFSPITSTAANPGLGFSGGLPSPPPGLSGLTRSAVSPPTSNGLTSAFSRPPALPSPPPGLNGFVSDDDLGFDPFSESAKGLADLLEEERRYQPSGFAPSPLSHNHVPFGLGINSYQQQAAAAHAAQQNYLAGLQMQLMAAAAEQREKQREREREQAAVMQHQHEQWMRSMQQSALQTAPNQHGMPNGHLFGPQQNHQIHGQQHKSHHPLDLFANSRMESQSAFAPPPGLGVPQAPSSRSTISSQSSHSLIHQHVPSHPQAHQHMQQTQQQPGQQSHQAKSSSLTEWQEGLKALLPNVNIRFAPDLDQVGETGGWARWSHSSQPAQQQMGAVPQQQHPMHHHNHHGGQQHVSPAALFSAESGQRRILSHIHVPPPPGFTVPAVADR